MSATERFLSRLLAEGAIQAASDRRPGPSENAPGGAVETGSVGDLSKRSPQSPGADAERDVAENVPGSLSAAAPATEVIAIEQPVYRPPALLSLPNPIYPAAARRLRTTAEVTLRVRVGLNGQAEEVEVKGPHPTRVGPPVTL